MVELAANTRKMTDGNVRDLIVIKRAHSSALDAVQRAAPFPRPPASLFKRELLLELTIVFELT